MSNEPPDLTRIERGMDRLNEKLDNVMHEIMNVRVQGAQHFSKLETHDEDIKNLKEDFNKYKEESNKTLKSLEIDHSNLKTKIGPLFLAVSAVISLIISKLAETLWR